MRVYLPVMNAGMPSFEKILLLWSIPTCDIREFTYALPIYPPPQGRSGVGRGSTRIVFS